MPSGSGNGLAFGQTYVRYPTGAHKATIVWLHDIGRTGSNSEKAVGKFKNPNIKWICPTAPLHAVPSASTMRTNAWFDVYTKVSEGMQDDLVSLDYVNTYVTTLLSSEPPHVLKGVGGVGMGAAQALFYASGYAFGRVPIDLKMVIGIHGRLPNLGSLKTNINNTPSSILRSISLRILITHGTSDDNIPATFVQSSFVNKCVDSLRSVGFPTWFKPCGGTQAVNEIRTWLLENGLQT